MGVLGHLFICCFVAEGFTIFNAVTVVLDTRLIVLYNMALDCTKLQPYKEGVLPEIVTVHTKDCSCY